MENRLEAPICERGNDLIAFLYGEVNEHEARDFERHLRSCLECKLELGAFKQIRSSVGVWRQEALSAAPAHSAARSTVAAPANRAFEPRRPSAVAAIREFFDLSPLWMKGTIALASVLFCIFSVLAVSWLLDIPKPLVANDKLYTEKELQAKIEEALQSTVQNQDAQKSKAIPSSVVVNQEPQGKTQRRGANGSSVRTAASPQVGRLPLTRSEREQLAADLRLIFPQDEADLDLLGDRLNK